MPCRVDVCEYCHRSPCECVMRGPEQAKRMARAAVFDYEGALCDVLTLVEKRAPGTLKLVDPNTLAKWAEHRKAER